MISSERLGSLIAETNPDSELAMTLRELRDRRDKEGDLTQGVNGNIEKNRHVTMTGRSIFFARMTVDDVNVDEVPHALSMICRYNGLVKWFYSVAQHSVLVCELAELDHGKGSQVAKAALLHDTAEAYIGDISTPLKNLLPDYKRLEHRVEGVMRQKFDLPEDPEIWRVVRNYDMMACFIEAKVLLYTDYSWVKPVEQRYREVAQANVLRDLRQVLPEQARRLMRHKMQDYGISMSNELDFFPKSY